MGDTFPRLIINNAGGCMTTRTLKFKHFFTDTQITTQMLLDLIVYHLKKLYNYMDG